MLALSIATLLGRRPPAEVPAGFSPSELFAASEVGVWYDPSDFSTLFENTDGTGAISTVEKPVGRMLDKSGNGFHATAANNSTARPVLRSRYNLLTYSEQFDNAAWTKANATITANAATAPDGTTTADKLIPSSTNIAAHAANQAVLPAASCTFSCYAKAGEYTKLMLWMSTVGKGYGFDLSSGTTFAVTGITSAASASIVNVGGGWYRCSISVTETTATRADIYVLNSTSYSSFAGNDVDGIYIWGAQLVANSVFPSNTYQRIAAATDYSTGADFPPYLAFTTDDAMSTASIDFSGTDEMSVFAGVTKNSDAAFGAFTELSASSGGNNGAFGVLLPQSATAGAQFRSRGTASADAAVSSGYPAPLSLVLTGLGEISADTSVLRLNGSQAATSATDQGTGNYGNYPLYIGARNNASNFFNGSLYSLIVRGKTSTATEIQSTENYVAGKLGRSITWAYDYLVDDAGNFITTDSGDQIYVAETVTFT